MPSLAVLRFEQSLLDISAAKIFNALIISACSLTPLNQSSKGMATYEDPRTSTLFDMVQALFNPFLMGIGSFLHLGELLGGRPAFSKLSNVGVFALQPGDFTLQSPDFLGGLNQVILELLHLRRAIALPLSVGRRIRQPVTAADNFISDPSSECKSITLKSTK